MIHVCYGLYDADGRYSKFTGTSILSMFENTRAEVTVHLLHDNTLTDDNRDNFSDIAEKYNQPIKFYNVEKICAAEIENIKKLFEDGHSDTRFSQGTFYRLFMPQIIADDIEKIIYLDSDIIVNLDISELWQIPLGKPIAAVSEISNDSVLINTLAVCKEGLVDTNDYFNAGVVVLNLNHIRQNEMDNLREKMKFIAQNPQYQCLDQDLLNLCFSTNYLKLPNKFNFFVRESRLRNEFEVDNRIIHYLGNTLNLNIQDPFNALWFNCFTKTNWFNGNVIARLYENLTNLHIELKNFAAQVSRIMSGKSRVFFVEEVNLDVLQEVFYVKDDEEIILAKDLDSINLLKKSIKTSNGKKMHFILSALWYHEIRAELLKEGFVEGNDFINALMFLSEAQGLPLNTYNFIKAI